MISPQIAEARDAFKRQWRAVAAGRGARSVPAARRERSRDAGDLRRPATAPRAGDYESYSGFWAVQKWLSDPPRALKGAEEKAAFLKAISDCCEALEGSRPCGNQSFAAAPLRGESMLFRRRFLDARREGAERIRLVHA